MINLNKLRLIISIHYIYRLEISKNPIILFKIVQPFGSNGRWIGTYAFIDPPIQINFLCSRSHKILLLYKGL